MTYKSRYVEITIFDNVQLTVIGMFSEEDRDFITDFVRYKDQDITEQLMEVDFMWEIITNLCLEKCYGDR